MKYLSKAMISPLWIGFLTVDLLINLYDAVSLSRTILRTYAFEKDEHWLPLFQSQFKLVQGHKGKFSWSEPTDKFINKNHLV